MQSFEDPAVPVDVIPVETKRWNWFPVLIAWLVIAGIILAELGVSFLLEHRTLKATESSKDDVALLIMQLQGRYLVGAAQLFGSEKGQLYSRVSSLNTGSIDQRLRFVVLAGELSGPEEALAQLEKLEKLIADNNYEASDKQADLEHALRMLYRDYAEGRLDSASLPPGAGQMLRDELGWFGELALAPEHGPNADSRAELLASARQTLAAVLFAAIVFGLLGLGGAAGLFTFFVLVLIGRVGSRLHVPTGHGGVYAETFALYMFLFFSMSLGVSLLIENLKIENAKLVLAGGVMLLSLSALAWPVLRGIPWKSVREDIGWTRGSQPSLEVAAGVGGYAMSVPILAVGVIIVFVLLFFSQLAFQGAAGGQDTLRPSNLPSHPIIQILAQPDWWQRLQVWVVASIVAPIVEETMFRGVLYRHLREGSQRLGTLLSILFSGTVASFIFAVIHPQGLIAVPALMALAYGFTILREWRGTVIPCMVAHGVNNGLVTIIAMLALSG